MCRLKLYANQPKNRLVLVVLAVDVDVPVTEVPDVARAGRAGEEGGEKLSGVHLDAPPASTSKS